jgi:hypothetical protein
MNKIIITTEYEGKKIERVVYGDFQAFIVINQLKHDGCKNIGMREEE